MRSIDVIYDEFIREQKVLNQMNLNDDYILLQSQKVDKLHNEYMHTLQNSNEKVAV